MNEYYKIEEICKVKGGKRIPQGCTLQEMPNEHPYIRILDMYQGRILNISGEMQYAREEYWNIIKRYIVEKGDVILAIVGNTLGMVSVIGDTLDGANLTENCCKFNDLDTDRVRKLFLYYSLIAPLNQKNIEKFKVGSSQPKLPIYNINQLLVPKWSVDIQDKIVSILSAIDSKIENNNKINQELESMAKTIYDYWFLQFEFPKEDGKPYKSSGGKMVLNEELKREIPEGWEVKGIDDFGILSNGINYSKDEIGDKNYKIVNVRNMSNTSLLLDKSDMDDIVLKAEMADKYLLKGSDILIARSGIPGAIRILEDSCENTLYCGFIIRLSLETDLYRKYLVYKLKDYEDTTATSSGGTVMQNVSQNTLKNIKFVVPEKNYIQAFNDRIDSIWSVMKNKNKENQELMSLREFLLPLLMNGQVGFKE